MNWRLLYLSLFFLPSFVLGQSIKGGLAAGLNMTQVDGDEVYGFHKFGLNAGAMAIIPVGKKFSASIETAYTQKGSYQSPQSADSASGEYKLILDYVEVPVLFSYIEKDIIKVGTGLSWAKLVNFKEWEHGNRVEWDTPNGPYKSTDLDILIDLQLKITQGLHFNFRYAYSLGKIRTRTFHNMTGSWTREQYNNDLSFRLIYIFKDSPSQKKKKTETDKIK